MPLGFGRGPYGRRRYGGYSAIPGRPFGIGAYGVGPYSVYGAGVGNVFRVQGRTGVVFSLSLPRPPYVLLLRTNSSLVFNVRAGLQTIYSVAAMSRIVFSVSAELTFAWEDAAPCGAGAWQPAGPCRESLWQPLDVCGDGTWTKVKLI
jgi:hypothetical protein